jgi:hypothetical protein
MGTTGTTAVAFSDGKVLFNILTVEFVSLIVVIGRSEVVGVCACNEFVRAPIKVKVIIAVAMINRFMIFIVY